MNMLPQYGDRVDVWTCEAVRAAETGGSTVGEIKEVHCRDGVYSCRVLLGGASKHMMWCALEALTVIRRARRRSTACRQAAA